MRITDKLTFDFSQRHLSKLREQFAKAQEAATTGRRVQSPSGSPLAMALAMRHRSRELLGGEHLRMAEAGRAAIEIADAALDGVSEALRRVQELAIQASNDTLTADERAAIAQEVAGLRDSIVSLANTEQDGSYVFAGFLDDAPPFDAAGNYSGDSNSRQLEAAPGMRINVSVAGDRVFGASGGVDIIGMLNSFETALQANDENGIHATLDLVGQSHDQITNVRAELSAQVEAFDVARSISERMKDHSVKRQTELVGIDPIDAYTDLSRAQAALQAAVQVAAQLPPPGLLR